MPTDQELYQQYLKETAQPDQSADPLYQQYLKETGGAQAAKPTAGIDKKGDVIVDEMHPELTGVKGTLVRAVYKNFGADPVASFNYLQKQFPNMEWKLDDKGEPIVKAKGETEYKRLDPTGFDIRDIGDIGYDVASGIGQGVATAAAGLAGGAAAGPAGAIPAAMAASAATGAGSEALRQKLGQWAGIDQNVSGKDVALSGAIGAVSPLLLGTGAGASQVAKQALKTGLSEAEQLALGQAQRGGLGVAYDKAAGYVGPRLTELASGIPKEITQTAAKMLPTIQAADKNPEVYSTPFRDAAKEVPKILKQKTQEVGGKLSELRGMIDAPVEGQTVASIPTESFVKPFQETIAKLEATSTGSPAEKADLAKFGQLLESEFKDLPEMMTAAQVDAKSQRFKDLAEKFGLQYNKAAGTTSALEGAGAYDRQMASAFESSRKNMQEAIVNRLEQMSPDAAQEYAQSKEAYALLKNTAEQHKSNFKDSKSVRNFLNRSINDPNELQNLLDLQNATGYDLVDLAKESKAIQTFSRPSGDVQSLKGATSTSKTIPLALAGGALGYYAGQQSGGEYSPYLMSFAGGMLGAKSASPAMIRRYMELNSAARALPQAAGAKFLPYSLMNIERNSK